MSKKKASTAIGIFIEGMGSILDIFPSSVNRPHTINMPTYSDGEAIGKDWEAIGNDIWYSMQTIKNR